VPQFNSIAMALANNIDETTPQSNSTYTPHCPRTTAAARRQSSRLNTPLATNPAVADSDRPQQLVC